MYFKGKKFETSQARCQISVYRKITITCSNHEATTFRLNRNLATLLRQQAISSETDRNSAPLNYYFETLYFHPPKPYSRLGRGTRIKNGSTPVGSARMRYQRCTLCRKTKISYSLVPFSSPCNRSSNFIVNHHVSVLFSPLSLSLSLSRSFFPSACVSFFVRVLRYTPSNSFHCRCLLSATITRRVKDPSGNVNPILSPSVSAPVRLEFPPLYLRSVSRTFIPLERFVVCPAGTCSFLILLSNIASSSLSSPWPRFLSLFFFSDFSPFLSPFVRLSSSFITPFV